MKLYLFALLAAAPVPPPPHVWPATPEQILCGANSMVVGQIQDTLGEGCYYSGCVFMGEARLVIKIREIIGTSHGEIARGSIVSVDTRVDNVKSDEIHRKIVEPYERPYGHLEMLDDGSAITSDRLQRELLGRKYLFGIGRKSDSKTYRATAYALDQAPWIRKIWLSGACFLPENTGQSDVGVDQKHVGSGH